MCGICGIAHGDPVQHPDTELLGTMAQSLAHRGPDDSDVIITTHVGLGHRRLSVVGVSTGHQPMEDTARGTLLSFNGEIYNFRDLRSELEDVGAAFKTDSDTEVLLKGYGQWGMDQLLRRIVGMYAFALWDGRNKQLFLVRDRLGVKPLYYVTTPDGSLYFASESRALRVAPAIDNTVDHEALMQFLSFGYVTGHGSISAGVQQVDSGSYLRWQPGQPPRQCGYWNLAEVWTERQSTAKLSARDQEEAFSALLDQCVQERLVSEVPLGAFLSGGLDSSLICARMLEHTSPLKTFSMGFEERSYSELPWARLVAQELGTDHAEAIVSCDNPDLLVEVAAHLDEPFADTSILPTYVLCREARKHLTVALSGDGGDELLAGYTTHAADKLNRYLQHAPGFTRRSLQHLVELLPDSRAKVGVVFKLKQFLSGSHGNACDAHSSWRRLMTQDALRDIVAMKHWDDTVDAFAPFRRAYEEVPQLNALDRMLFVDYKTWLASDILVKVDRASMAHGLEVRSPFLDHRLVEFCAGLPPSMKLNGFRGKHIMRKVARGQVPEGVIRRKKAGFNSPVSHWIAGPWRELVHDTLGSANTLPYLNPQAVCSLLEEHDSGKRDHGFRIFPLLMLGLWHQQHGGADLK